jgi:hypothetical protein
MSNPSEWIQTASKQAKRELQDQTESSLQALMKVARRFEPDRIVELGTGYGLSLRAWLEVTECPVVSVDCCHRFVAECIDAQLFTAEELERVQFVERDVRELAMPYDLWPSRRERVLLYVDVPGAKTMKNILYSLPSLPSGSLVVVDDMWLTDVFWLLGAWHVNFLSDSLGCESRAPYWLGGTWHGFPGVVPLLDWINERMIVLWPMTKFAWFWPTGGVR